ncbi:late embryogenesis abundant protein At1g64065-like [Cornus florida]|uniref:late embryogenesis abundant protein At1g64065-like n=1 Tax=Cornus florida TaxID=4283 RepID=UPI0028971608|nr:late embryogenesis abundant protein At1g64065-like [Cornus florida]
MAEKEQQQGHNSAAPYNYGRADEEAQTKELKRQKRKKLILYIAAFAVFQTIVIVIFSLTVMKVKTPKFRVRTASFETFSVTASSFDMRMNARLGVKNTNFGPYKFDNSIITFYYRGAEIGNAFVPKSTAKFQSSKRFNVTINLSSTNLPTSSELGSDFNSGILPLSSTSRLTGKVELMLVMKKKKAINMNCTMEVNISSQQIQNLKCK